MQHVFSCLPYATMAGWGDGLLVLLLIQQNNLRFRQLALEEELLRRRRRRPPAFWVRPWLSVPRKLMYGHYHRLMRELRMEDTTSFCNFMRMEPQMFDELVDRLSPRITLQDTNWRKALEPGLKVAVTLRYLASGDRYPGLSYSFRVSRHTIAKFIPQVCQAIVNENKNEVVACPTTPEEWRTHDDVIKWKHFPRYWPFVREIHRSPVNFPHKGQWRGALMFTLICVRINGWANNHEAGDLRRNRAHRDVTVMHCWCVWKKMEHPSCCRCIGWEARRPSQARVRVKVRVRVRVRVRKLYLTSDSVNSTTLALTWNEC